MVMKRDEQRDEQIVQNTECAEIKSKHWRYVQYLRKSHNTL